MNNTPLVTSILITYNHGQSVGKALDSMLAQKTDFQHKILIADDCSTDGTAQTCRDYAARFPDQIEFSPRKTNLGIVKNIYGSIETVTSEFFAMLEGDDYWCDEFKLQKQVDALRANPDCSFCGHNTLRIDNEGNERPLFTSKKHNMREKYRFPKRYRKKDFVKIHPSSRLFRTSCLDLKNLKFEDSIVWDSSAYWYFLSKGNLFYIDEIMSVYHYNGKGAFSGSSKIRQRCMSILNTININEEFDFKYNHIFMPCILRHSNFLHLSPWIRLVFKFNPRGNLEQYHALRKAVETQLRSA